MADIVERLQVAAFNASQLFGIPVAETLEDRARVEIERLRLVEARYNELAALVERLPLPPAQNLQDRKEQQHG